ncbi:MAG: hypothetical protein AAFO95_13530 [Cyanobacteria bacterium J06600_6]
MPLANARSILRQTILLFNPLHNLKLMISRHNWFFGIASLTAVFCASVDSLRPQAIAILLVFLSLVLLATISKSASNDFNYQIQGNIRSTVILISLIVICLIIPQVETDMANFRSPINNLENRTRLT